MTVQLRTKCSVSMNHASTVLETHDQSGYPSGIFGVNRMSSFRAFTVLGVMIALALALSPSASAAADGGRATEKLYARGIVAFAIESEVPPEMLRDLFASRPLSTDYGTYRWYSHNWSPQGGYSIDGEMYWFGHEYAELHQVLRLLKMLLDFPSDWPRVSLLLDEAEKRLITKSPVTPRVLAHMIGVPSSHKCRFTSTIYALTSRRRPLAILEPMNSEDPEYAWILRKLMVPYTLVPDQNRPLAEALLYGDRRLGVAFQWSVFWVDAGEGRYLYFFEPYYLQFFDSVEVLVEEPSAK